jgi:hypothetical protein
MPDFGIMRGFNEKLFGDKLVAGQLPTQLGLIGSSDFAFDVDAQAFFDRITAAGGTFSATEKTAVDTLVKQMKLDGIWTKMKAIYPMVGASAAACAQNLKSASFTGIFNGGVTYASGGVTFNGTTGYLNSQLNASTNLSPTSLSFGGYTSTTADAAGYHGAFPPNYLMHSFKSFSFTEYYRTDGTPIAVSGGTLGMVQANQSGTTSKIYTNNTIGASGTATLPSLPNTNMFIGATSNNGTASFYDLRLVSYYYYADALTDTQASNHYTAVQAFQTTLSRNV